MTDDKAAHPVWSSDNPALKQEFRRVEERARRWEQLHSRVDCQAERFQEALEAIGALNPENASDAPQIALNALARPQSAYMLTVSCNTCGGRLG